MAESAYDQFRFYPEVRCNCVDVAVKSRLVNLSATYEVIKFDGSSRELCSRDLRIILAG